MAAKFKWLFFKMNFSILTGTWTLLISITSLSLRSSFFRDELLANFSGLRDRIWFWDRSSRFKLGKSKISSGMEFSKLFGKLSAVKFLRKGLSAFLEIICNRNKIWILSEFIRQFIRQNSKLAFFFTASLPTKVLKESQ